MKTDRPPLAGQGSIFDAPTVPVHRHNTAPSELAAATRAAGKAGSQTRRAFAMIAWAGNHGITNREIQEGLWEPHQPAWNKVPTRTLDLARRGLVAPRFDVATGRRECRGLPPTLVYYLTPVGAAVWQQMTRAES